MRGPRTLAAAGGLCALLALLPGCWTARPKSPPRPPAVQGYALCAEVVTSRGTQTLPVDLSPNYAIHVSVPAVIRFRACREPRRPGNGMRADGGLGKRDGRGLTD
ncbi:MAG TPA: hypothetical protein VGG03_05590 [Thermoanaerobaculia bacterium]